VVARALLAVISPEDIFTDTIGSVDRSVVAYRAFRRVALTELKKVALPCKDVVG
jgi:hypothetical protein